jgi:hypothetical protein
LHSPPIGAIVGTVPDDGAPRFDVFLSYNSADRPAVKGIADRLRAAGLEPWLGEWYLLPGEPWQQKLQEALGRSRCCAAFVGPNGVGDWSNEEIDFALDRAAHDGSFRVFSVLLPGTPEPFDPGVLRMGLTNVRGSISGSGRATGAAPTTSSTRSVGSRLERRTSRHGAKARARTAGSRCSTRSTRSSSSAASRRFSACLKG